MTTIKGKIVFKTGAPKSLPDGSTLVVQYNDTSLMDAPCKRLGQCIKTINNYKEGDVLTYEITANQKAETDYGSTVSATLNVGWKPSGDEWIRRGDYLTDTSHTVTIIDGASTCEKDIEVIHYT